MKKVYESQILKNYYFSETRRVNGMPTFEVIPGTTPKIAAAHLGHQKFTVMVMNDRFTSFLFNVNRPPSNFKIWPWKSMVKAMHVVKAI